VLKTKKPPKPPVSYSLAPAVKSTAARLISYNGSKDIPGLLRPPLPKGSALPGMSLIKEANILFLFTTAEKIGRDAAAQASKFAKKHLPLTDSDYSFEIVVSKPYWDRLGEDQRAALTYHELLHCSRNEKEQWVIARHDLEEFRAVVTHFGLWSPAVAGMYEQMKLWDAHAGVRLVK
jgi:hypothetical protein